VLFNLFYFAITQRLKIENKKDSIDAEIVTYLEAANDINALLNEKVLVNLPERDITEEQVFEHILDEYLTPQGIRNFAFKSSNKRKSSAL
jgi:hypothetical protein